MRPPPFVLFGAAHVAALLATILLASALALLVRRSPHPGLARAVRLGLAATLLALTVATLAVMARSAPLSWWDVVPLHLCDFLILVAVFALLTRNPLACELLYFWAGTGTLLAMVTPDLAIGFPDWRCLSYFALHGAVVASAVVMTFGLGMAPRPAAFWRVFILTNVYAAAVALVDVVWDANFLYLCGKPAEPTILDLFGPWPLYLLVAEAVALALFYLLELPFRLSGNRPA